jgi:hypothetical protein
MVSALPISSRDIHSKPHHYINRVASKGNMKKEVGVLGACMQASKKKGVAETTFNKDTTRLRCVRRQQRQQLTKDDGKKGKSLHIWVYPHPIPLETTVVYVRRIRKG